MRAPDTRAGNRAPAMRSRLSTPATYGFRVRSSLEAHNRLSCPRSADTALNPLNLCTCCLSSRPHILHSSQLCFHLYTRSFKMKSQKPKPAHLRPHHRLAMPLTFLLHSGLQICGTSRRTGSGEISSSGCSTCRAMDLMAGALILCEAGLVSER